MKAYDWKEKLTPWDGELFLMVESLTGKPCEPKNGGDHYFFEADYSNHNNPDFITALWDAIEGRLGKRLAGMDDDPERQVLIVTAYFSNEKTPALMQRTVEAKENPGAGTPYYSKTDDFNEILAVQVKEKNIGQLLEFVGNGQMLIPKNNPAKAVFSFRNACGSVYADAPLFSYVVYRGPGRFEVIEREKFEKEHDAG